MRILYAVALALSAALLFLVQPMVAKMALPRLGGSPVVWNTCMVFFQATLLAGYAYAHGLTSWIGRKGQLAAHAVVLVAPLALLPLGLASASAAPDPGAGVVALLGALLFSVGPPFFVLASTAPLLQRWLGSEDPYSLYAVSNAGSFVGLLAFPFALEPMLSLRSQSLVWSWGYGIFVLLVLSCGVATIRSSGPERLVSRSLGHGSEGRQGSGGAAPGGPQVRGGAAPGGPQVRGGAAPGGRPSLGDTPSGGPPRLRDRRFLLWLLLAAVPSSAMLGATQVLTTDIAPVPLLWVLPLATYLLTFVLAFSRVPRTWERVSSVGVAVLSVGVAASFWALGKPWTCLLVSLHLLTLFAVGLLCHGRLARERPPVAGLTGFYLLIGAGGVLGGAFNALAAPLLFRSFVEYPVALVLACLLRPPSSVRRRAGPWLDLALPAGLALLVVSLGRAIASSGIHSSAVVAAVQVGVPSVACLFLLSRPLRFALGLTVLFVLGAEQAQATTPTLFGERTYLGVYKVRRIEGLRVAVATQGVTDRPAFHVLYHGTTRHGSERVGPGRARPTSYYHPSGPIGQLFGALGGEERFDRIAVIGLGVGAIAAYGRTGQSLTYYEIDPAVIGIARSRYFTYLRDSAATIDCKVGDGRLSIATAPDGAYGLIVVDAFHSDAIPVHLLTRDALAVYRSKLQPDGIVAFHLTNQYLGLEPVIDALAQDQGLRGLVQWDEVKTAEDMIDGKDASTWALLARDPACFGALWNDPRWAKLPLQPGAPASRRFLWTDDYSSLWSVLK